MTRFINPYNFIPVAKTPGPSCLPIDDFVKGKAGHVRHDRWLGGSDQAGPKFCSGRIICELEAETEFFVGSEQTRGQGNQPTRIEPYRINGQLAIPGSSLRGMIGSVLEAATNSALRVLENVKYSKKRYPRRSDLPPTISLHSAREHFESVSERLLPLTQEYRRHHLSIAEQILGFVEDRGEVAGNAEELGPCLALASRVRLSAALPQVGSQPVQLDSVVMKILASPKPPCPAFYFEPTDQGAGLGKDDLQTPRAPRGRKVYLHHSVPAEVGADGRQAPWSTLRPGKDLDQKLSIRPIKRGARFAFDVEFDNLSRNELELLCFALRPSPEFRHKLGLGKPLGLGTVRVDPAAILLIDREARYRGWTGYTSPRFRWSGRSSSINSDRWPSCYEPARKALEGGEPFDAPEALASRGMRALESLGAEHRSIVDALLRFGDPSKSRSAPIHYPQVLGCDGNLLESEHFTWFAENEKRGPQRRALPSASNDDLSLPRYRRA